MWTGERWRVLVVAVLAVLAGVLTPALGDAEVMSHVTAHFGTALEECRKEANLDTSILEEFHHMWAEDFQLVHREFGCALICMSNKFSLMKDDAKMHHDNIEEYVKSFPNGEMFAKKMSQMLHTCEQNNLSIKDDCDRIIKIAACFKKEATKEGIAPDLAMIETLLEQH